MRPIALAVLLSFTACAGAPATPAKVADASPTLEAVEFASVDATQKGGRVFDTQYSEKPKDAEVLKKEFKNGVVSYTCMVGYSYGSAWAGVGLNVNMTAMASPIDARRFKSITIALASQATRTLRVRIIGADDKVRMNGCYPVFVQGVTDKLAQYTIPLTSFASESYCGNLGQNQAVPKTMGQLVGFEIADTTIHNEPSKFSVGTIRLNL
jgi:hypothetical protein